MTLGWFSLEVGTKNICDSWIVYIIVKSIYLQNNIRNFTVAYVFRSDVKWKSQPQPLLKRIHSSWMSVLPLTSRWVKIVALFLQPNLNISLEIFQFFGLLNLSMFWNVSLLFQQIQSIMYLCQFGNRYSCKTFNLPVLITTCIIYLLVLVLVAK